VKDGEGTRDRRRQRRQGDDEGMSKVGTTKRTGRGDKVDVMKRRRR
jgi:hypothetical protein